MISGRIYRVLRLLGICCILLGVFNMLQLPVIIVAQDKPEEQFIQLINYVRQREGLAPYDTSTLLDQAAQSHAEALQQ